MTSDYLIAVAFYLTLAVAVVLLVLAARPYVTAAVALLVATFLLGLAAHLRNQPSLLMLAGCLALMYVAAALWPRQRWP